MRNHSIMIALLLSASSSQAQPDAAGIQFFETKVRPLLVTQCQGCHSSKGKMAYGGLRLDQRALFFQGGQSGPLLVPGKPGRACC